MRLSKLDLNLLVVLDTMLERGSVSRTAQQLLLTQPAVSNALARLRVHFKDDLFVMTGRNLTPTPLARSMRDEVRHFINLSRQIVSKRGEFDPATAMRRFSVVCSDNMGVVMVSPLAQLCAQQAPGICLQFVQIDSHAIGQFNEGKFDIMVAPRYLVQPGANQESLLWDDYCVIADRGNDRYGATLSLDEYRRATVVSARMGDLSHLCLGEESLIAQGIVAEARIICAGFLPLAPMVVGTPHIALAHRSYASIFQNRWPIRVIEPAFELPRVEQVMMWRRHLDGDPAAAWLRDKIRTVALPGS